MSKSEPACGRPQRQQNDVLKGILITLFFSILSSFSAQKSNKGGFLLKKWLVRRVIFWMSWLVRVNRRKWHHTPSWRDRKWVSRQFLLFRGEVKGRKAFPTPSPLLHALPPSPSFPAPLLTPSFLPSCSCLWVTTCWRTETHFVDTGCTKTNLNWTLTGQKNRLETKLIQIKGENNNTAAG